jgi:hypothetical protein
LPSISIYCNIPSIQDQATNSPVGYRTSHKPTYIQKSLNKQKYTNKCFKIIASVIQNTGQYTILHE